jgi:hypothetical protein
MVKQCGDKTIKSAVEIECRVTKCNFSSRDSANHVIEITNQRKASIYAVESCTTLLNKLVDLSQVGKQVSLGKTVSASNKPVDKQLGLTHLGVTGTEEIDTVVEFYDSNQRLANGAYQGAKESYNVDYEMQVV